MMDLNGSGSRYGFDESKILELMLSNGFKTYSYNPFTRKLIDLKGNNLDSGNTSFIRDKSIVEDKLRVASKLTIDG